jgi:hypothetical protein
MSLLDDASLLVTPNAEKATKLYSIIPTNGNGDFTVTRATTATRVNAAGLVELVPYNLFTWSEKFDNAAWLVGGGGPSVFTSNFSTAPNGTTTASRWTAANLNSQVRQNLATINTPMTISVWMRTNTGTKTAVLFINDSEITSNITVTTSWQRFTLSGVVGGTLLGGGRCGFSNNSILTTSDYIEVWGAQIVQGTSALDYQMTETRLNIPRLDYSLGSCPNILLEPQRTNLVQRSEEFDNAWWSKNAISITANTTTSPSGVVNADTLDEGTTSSIHRLAGSAVSVTAGSTNSFSLYVKKGTMRYFRLAINDANDTTRWIAGQFDLDTQTFTTGSGGGGGGTIVSTSIQSVGNGWFRVNLVGSLTLATQVFPIIFCADGTAINSGDTRGGGIYSGTNRTLFIWGAQLEAGAYATSYIPTTSASVTRNADVISRGNIFTNGLITASGGTWFVELRNNIDRLRDIGGPGLALSDITTGAITALSLRNFTQRLTISKYILGAPTTLYTTTTDIIKVAFKWNGTTADVFVNGVKVVSATPFAITALEWIINPSPVDVPKYINSMALFPTPLTDTQCIALTT